VESVKVIIDSSNLSKLLALIPKKNVKKIVGNLAEIVASEPEWILESPGVVATMANELFENGVNLREFLTCSPATIIVVDEKDAWKAYEALRRLQ
jgi:aspartokinase